MPAKILFIGPMGAGKTTAIAAVSDVASIGTDLELAAGGNTEVMRSKVKTMQMLGLEDAIEDILITLGKQYHLIRPLAKSRDLFVYYVLDKSRANLALARRKLVEVGEALEV